MTTIIHNTSGESFELSETHLTEVKTGSSLCVAGRFIERKAVRRALWRSKWFGWLFNSIWIDVAYPKQGKVIVPHPHRLHNERYYVSIGCKIFSYGDADRLRQWAQTKPDTKKA